MKRREADIETGVFDFSQTKKQITFDAAIKSFLENYSIPNKKSYKSDINSSKALLRYFGGKKN